MLKALFVGGPANGVIETRSTCPDRLVVNSLGVDRPCDPTTYKAVAVDFKGAIYLSADADQENWATETINLFVEML